MEEMYPLEQLTRACGNLRIDPNYSPDSHNGFSDNDDDPLRCPEITVKINDDWTVSSEENYHATQYDLEESDEDSDEDEAEVYTLDDRVINSFISDIVSLSQKEAKKEASSDEDEQIVPSSPKIRKLSLGDGLTLSIREVAGGDEKRCPEDRTEVKSKTEERKEEEKKYVSDGETENRSDVGTEIAVNRSKPQPP